MDELKAIFASNLIRYRTAAGMTQLELGEKIHYSDKSISKWERAEAIPDAYVLTQLAALFGVTVNDLLMSNTAWKPVETEEEQPVTNSRLFITLCSLAGIWTLCIFQFALLWALGNVYWVILMAGVPLSLVTLLVYNSIWFHGRRNMYIIGALVLSVILLLTWIFRMWQLTLVVLPAELVVYLACNIRNRGKK